MEELRGAGQWAHCFRLEGALIRPRTLGGVLGALRFGAVLFSLEALAAGCLGAESFDSALGDRRRFLAVEALAWAVVFDAALGSEVL